LESSSAYLLVSHGSRDPRPQREVEVLAGFVSQRLQQQMLCLGGTYQGQASPTALLTMPSVAIADNQSPLVGSACLELASLPLHRQIEEFGNQVSGAGCKRLQVVPLFLLPGVHVMEDIPLQVGMAQQVFGSDLVIDICPHLGSHSELGRLLENQMSAIAAEAWILLSHGSRRQQANQPVEALATKLGAVAAYWSVSPSLAAQVTALVNAGYDQIGILPYFLFAGGITDAIAQKIAQLSQELRGINLRLASPIGASVQLADLILDLIQA
jgi:sirohydrochlorin cobaltochelatase